MNLMFRFRLLLDFVALSLIIACLAYWWLENFAHEVFGTVLFTLVIGHNVFNRLWYGRVARGKYDGVRWLNIITIAVLKLVMTIMLVTSMLISRDLFTFLALDGAFAMREVHMFAAYWLLFIVSVHLGTRWGVIMNTCRAVFGIRDANPVCTWSLRLAATAVSLWGIKSWAEMAFGSKLVLTYSLDMWDFNESTLGFFLNYGAIVGLLAAATHYSLAFIRGGARPTVKTTISSK